MLEAASKSRRWLGSLALLTLLTAPLIAADDEETAPPNELRFVRLDLLDSRGGYAIPRDSVFYPGETIFLAFNIAGYTVSEDYRIDLEYRIDARGPGGTPFANPEGGEFAVELAPQDEGWEPLVQYQVKLPDHAPGGVYRLDIRVTDSLAEDTVAETLPVRVEGENVEVTEGLSVRNLEFARTEGGLPIEPPVYRHGESIFASFYITGYETAEDNTYDVESSMEVLDPEGETLLEFEPKGEEGSPFYPRLWLPAKFRLDLEGTPAGQYTIVLNVRDNVGQTDTEHRATFTVQ